MMHATFLSMYAALCLVFILHELVLPAGRAARILYTLCLLVLTAGLLQLCSKSVFFALMLIINVVFPYFLFKAGARRKFIGISILVSIALLAVIVKVDTFNTRYFADLNFDLQRGTSERITDPRLARWYAAADLIKEKPIAGYGSGSEIPLLKDEYFNRKLYSAYLNGFNAHNQYLSFLIKTGVVGLFIYLITLLYGVREANRSRNVVFMSFMMLIAVVSFSENMLDVNKGIFFYTIFYSLFIFSQSRKAS
jgi:O-antigen ligase